MIQEICSSLCQTVQENLEKAGAAPLPYDEDILRLVLENKNPYEADVSGLLHFPPERFVYALFAVAFNRVCDSPEAWKRFFEAEDETTAKRRIAQIISDSKEAQSRGLRLINDPFGAAPEEPRELMVPFARIR